MIKTYDNRTPHWSNDSEAKGKFLLFFIWPFGAWLYSLWTANTRSSYIIFFLFSILLCWHMAPMPGSEYDDFIGILDRFNSTNISSIELLTQIKNFFTLNPNAPKELYENIVIYLVKSFTDNYHIYFFICSIPVAFCQLKSLKRITSDIYFKAGNWIAILILAMFIFPRDIITVQNPRFTTGFWICLVSSIYCFSESRKKYYYLIPILLTPMIHSGMWLYLIIITIYVLIPHKVRLLEILVICSIPISFFDANLFHNLNLSFLPENLYRWSLLHFDPDNINNQAELRSGYWWVGYSFFIASKITYIYMIIKLINNKNDINNNQEAFNFYPFFLFNVFIVNLIQPIPVLGERYYWFIQIYTIYIWFKTFHLENKNIILALVITNLWGIIRRYGYILGGALSVNTDPDIFYTPLIYLIYKGFYI